MSFALPKSTLSPAPFSDFRTSERISLHQEWIITGENYAIISSPEKVEQDPIRGEDIVLQRRNELFSVQCVFYHPSTEEVSSGLLQVTDAKVIFYIDDEYGGRLIDELLVSVRGVDYSILSLNYRVDNYVFKGDNFSSILYRLTLRPMEYQGNA